LQFSDPPIFKSILFEIASRKTRFVTPVETGGAFRSGEMHLIPNPVDIPFPFSDPPREICVASRFVILFSIAFSGALCRRTHQPSLFLFFPFRFFSGTVPPPERWVPFVGHPGPRYFYRERAPSARILSTLLSKLLQV